MLSKLVCSGGSRSRKASPHAVQPPLISTDPETPVAQASEAASRVLVIEEQAQISQVLIIGLSGKSLYVLLFCAPETLI